MTQIKLVVDGEKTWNAAVSDYEQELIPRGAEEVKCSVENGIMLHDWEKVKQSPVFNAGFRPMKGHDTWEMNTEREENRRKAEAVRGARTSSVPAV